MQALIDEHRDGVKKTVQRQVSRLNTERRLLRSQATRLNTHQWLPQESVQTILNQIDVSKSDGRAAQPRSPNDKSPDVSLLIPLWTLYQILPLIGFSNLEREAALRDLLEQSRRNLDIEQGMTKDSIWGLDHCLDWLALATSRRESPRYDDSVERHQRTQPAPIQAKAVDVESRTTTESASNTSTQAKHPEVEQEEREILKDSVDTLTPDSSSDSDIEPAQLIHKYLSLQTRRFHLDPMSLKKQPKNTKRGDQTRAQVTVDSRIARIDAKLAKMKSDILFDIDEAESQWGGVRLDLIQEAADRRRLDIAEDGTIYSLQTMDPQVPHDQQSSTTQKDTDEEVLLGELFSSLPEVSTSTDGGSDRLQIASDTGLPMTVRDFGRWGGLHPRRILEETCRARSEPPIGFGVLG